MMSSKYIDNLSESCVKKREINKKRGWLRTRACLSIANYIINQVNGCYSRDEKALSLSTNRLQKLIFFSDALYMVEHYGKPMFEPETELEFIDDEYYVYPKGPSIPKIFSCFIGSEVGDMSTWCSDEYYVDDEDMGTRDIINRVLSDTADIPTNELIKMACEPWFSVYREDRRGCRIPKGEIYKYYREHGAPYGVRKK